MSATPALATAKAPALTAAKAAALAATIKPTDLRGILQYVPRFQGQIFVIAFDGSIVADENFGNLLVDVAVLRSLGIKVVLAHGIGQQLRELSQLRGVPLSDVEGTGITDSPTLDLAIRASARVSHLILEGLAQNNLKGASTNAVRALPLGIIRGVDQQFTAKVDRVDKDFLHSLINSQVIPVVSPLAFGPDGRSLRVNSDLLAAELAEALHATKIIYLTPQPGLEIGGSVQPQIAIEALREQLDRAPEQIAEQCRSKARHAVHAIDNGTPRVHIVDGRLLDSLLNEIFSGEGVGTLIYGNDYQQIRKANRRDVRFIYSLTRSAVKREELVQRTQQAIDKAIDQFYVFEIDENIIACVTLILYPPATPGAPKLAELGALYVLPFYQNRGIGQKMVEYACLMAKKQGAAQILALSTQSYGFFTNNLGFSEVDKSILPEARLRQHEESGRNAKVLARRL